MVYSQTQIMEQEVYLVELLGKRSPALSNLKAAVFIQPTEENLEILRKELRDPRFSEYHVFFSNIVSPEVLTDLAKADELEVVKQVQEYYADFLAINEDFFQFGQDKSLILSSPKARTLEAGKIYDRNVQGILACLLALKRRPSQIRYQSASDVCRRIAIDIKGKLESDDVFDFRRQEGPLLLLLDRRDDPVTPLLTQWTYQAMVHELLGLNNNRVSLKGAPGIRKDLEEVVLSITSDDFFAKNRFANFGDLGSAVKQLLDDYQSKSKMNENISSIEDMQNFMERYPAFRSQSINVSKHVAIMGELARLTDQCQLLVISKLEQDIACSNDHASHKAELSRILDNSRVDVADKIRLVLLYLIRYESYGELAEIKSALERSCNVESSQTAILEAMLAYAGESRRAQGLFAGGGLISQITKSVSSAINGVENVYTQHQPVLSFILDSILKAKLSNSAYPVAHSFVSNVSSRPSEVIVFIVGGATYEEALKVAEFNRENPGMRVILGGSCVHNSSSFLEEVGYSFGRN